MVNRILITYLIADILFLLTGGLLLAFPLLMNAVIDAAPNIDNVAQKLILDRCPMTASIINAIIIFVAFSLTLPALLMPTTRTFLKLQAYLITISAFLSLVLGLTLWFDTLKTRSNLSSVYSSLPPASQSLLQQKFNCCGYLSANSPAYVNDKTCTGSLQAALMEGCVGPLSREVNRFEDLVFTAAFGIVGIDVVMVLAVGMLVRQRGERERYRYIDMKGGIGGF